MAIPLSLSNVPDETPYIQYAANNGQTVYPYPFPITQDSDLVVVINGVTQNTDSTYTLSGQGNPTGGNVTFNSGSNVDDIVTLYRDIQIERLTQFAQNGGFSSSAFNAEFNNLYLICQQLEASIEQCLQIPNTNNPAPVTTLTPGAYANKYQAYDSNGNPTPAVLTSSGALTLGIITGLTAPLNTAEAAAGLTSGQINTGFLPGDLQRYKCDPTGVNGADAGILIASKCNAQVFDSYPGGGQYRIKNPVNLIDYPITFKGQAKGNGDVNGNTGTVFIIDAAVGAGGSAFYADYLDGVNFQDWGFKFATGNLGQFAFRVMALSIHGQLRSSTFFRCSFGGVGAGDTNCGLRVDSGTGGAEYSAFNVFDSCYFNGLLAPARFTGNTTPNAFSNCSFLGYTGVNAVNSLGTITPGSSYTNGTYANVPLTGGAGTGAVAHVQVAGGAVTQVVLVQGGTGYAAGNTLSATAASIGGTGTGFSVPAATVGSLNGCAIQVDYPGLEFKFGPNNYFEGFIVGIHSNGAANLIQTNNDYQVCTYGYVWVQTSYTVIGNQSNHEMGVGGVALGYSSLDASKMQGSGDLLTLTTGGAYQATRGFQEGSGSGTNLRTNHSGAPLLLGYGDSQSVVMAANGGGSISAQTTTEWSISYVGGHVYIDFNVSGTLTGSSTTALLLPVPGLSAVISSQIPCSVTNNGATAFGVAYVNTLGSNLQIGLGALGSGDFTAGTVGAVGQIKIRILS